MAKNKSKKNRVQKNINKKKGTKRKAKRKESFDTEAWFVKQVDKIIDLSFSGFVEGINSYFILNKQSPSLFLEKQGVGYNFSSGIRAYISEGDLKVSPPITWKPKEEIPLVRDYVAELYNSELEEFQLNAFNFILAPDEENQEKQSLPYACCVISFCKEPKTPQDAFVVIRKFAINSESNLVIEKAYEFGEDYVDNLDILDYQLEPLVDGSD